MTHLALSLPLSPSFAQTVWIVLTWHPFNCGSVNVPPIMPIDISMPRSYGILTDHLEVPPDSKPSAKSDNLAARV